MRAPRQDSTQLVELLQKQGHIVGMTGDGVNAAAALKRSDVGVAMGQRGSDVSCEVADLVLLDDNFATIVSAVEEGRGIYEDIQKFLRFLFSTHLSEVLLIAAGAILASGFDLRDINGALMLPLTGADPTDQFADRWDTRLALRLIRRSGVMRQLPRAANSPLLDRPSVKFVDCCGALGGRSRRRLITWRLVEAYSRFVWHPPSPDARGRIIARCAIRNDCS